MTKDILMVFLGGGVGSLFRYSVGEYIKSTFQSNIPLHTFLVNFLGCIVIGFSMDYLTKHPSFSVLTPLLIVGFCGGFTTFSAFGFETYEMLQRQQYGTFFYYTIGSIIFCLLGCLIGVFISEQLS
ncbi:MAG: fluoride efflux transporter CrcB [Saprospiraceae bacterium]|nr:fluoride efflux transporter CrcB [Saprospiraceae bacterium]